MVINSVIKHALTWIVCLVGLRRKTFIIFIRPQKSALVKVTCKDSERLFFLDHTQNGCTAVSGLVYIQLEEGVPLMVLRWHVSKHNTMQGEEML